LPAHPGILPACAGSLVGSPERVMRVVRRVCTLCCCGRLLWLETEGKVAFLVISVSKLLGFSGGTG